MKSEISGLIEKTILNKIKRFHFGQAKLKIPVRVFENGLRSIHVT